MTLIENQYSQRHGGPWDRGAADSWYRRPRRPHYFQGATYSTPEVLEQDMSEQEIAAYHAGYDWNEFCGGHQSFE